MNTRNRLRALTNPLKRVEKKEKRYNPNEAFSETTTLASSLGKREAPSSPSEESKT